ncbi:Pleckstrin -like proteiny domain-containing family O member 1 [Collichthys lucidus]|uniref:Pleckstrin-like proteiny domain-containing family O member 1 n=1 Tax=Collichthys lucidus TaxID=240159 RepID=A0A4U5V4G7_COLLU|nr:Pleckstrin -like proteiny domain-containing family O member 1 [Collichthys lucidus]
MKKQLRKRGPQDPAQQQNLQPEKVGWIRKFCGKGIFREIWKNRFVVLRGDQLFICEKEVKELGRADEVLDLSDYERCEEIRKNKSRTSTLVLRRDADSGSDPGGGLWEVSSGSRAQPGLPQIQNRCRAVCEDRRGFWEITEPPPGGGRGVGAHGPRPDAAVRKATDDGGENRCASMDEILTHSETKAAKNKTTAATRPLAGAGTVAPVNQLQELISQKLEKTERLLTEVRAEVEGEESSEGARAEAERLLKEAAAAWSQAREVLEEVTELRALYRQLDSSNSSKLNPDPRSPM